MNHVVHRVRSRLPEIEPCESLCLEAGDVLVNAPGFEDRTFAAVDALVPMGGGRAILLDYRPLDPKQRIPAMKERLAAKGVEVQDEDVLVYARFEPGDFCVRLRARLVALQARRLVLDTSSMSRLAIMLIMDVARQADLAVRVFYAEAVDYGPSREEFEEARAQLERDRPSLQIYTGVHGVIHVAELSSVAMQGEPTAAIMFMSFNEKLTQALLDSVYPSRLFLINGRPPVHEWREEATAWIHERVRREWEFDNPLAECREDRPIAKRVTSTLWYRETVAELLRLYWALAPDHRILLAPTGSKMQTVGCYLVKALHPDIHIEYPTPSGFLSLYSTRIARCWQIEFPPLGAFLRAISGEERAEFFRIRDSVDTEEDLVRLTPAVV